MEKNNNQDTEISKEEGQLEYYIGMGELTRQVLQGLKAEKIETPNLSNLPIKILVPDIDNATAEEFTQHRRAGFGGSDSSTLLGVNPYSNHEELIDSKIRTTLSEDEKAIATKAAVRKGNDLEPLMLKKAGDALGIKVFKGKDMYQFKDYPYLTMNFDGIGTFPKGHLFAFMGTTHNYAPIEPKAVSSPGTFRKYFNPAVAVYSEQRLFAGQDPWAPPPAPLSDAELKGWPIERKAAYFGIPPYYYTQVQQEMMALNANGGFLPYTYVADWLFFMAYIQKDPYVWNALKIEGYKLWAEIERRKGVIQEKAYPEELDKAQTAPQEGQKIYRVKEN